MSKFISFIILATFILPYAHGAEDSAYDFSWLDPDKEVYVLQNRKFRKAERVHMVAGLGITTSGAFVDSMNYQGRVGYFIREEWGFEFLYAKNNGKENDTASSVRNQGGAVPVGSTPFRRIINNYMGGMVLWSPFYAKINTFNKILYVDWIVGLGYAKLEETNNREEFIAGSSGTFSDTTESHGAILWDTALQFYISEHWYTRFDLTTMHYQAKKATSEDKNWYNNYDLSLSIGFNF